MDDTFEIVLPDTEEQIKELQNRIDALGVQLNQLSKHVTAKKRIVRDPKTNRISHVEIEE